MSMVDDQHQPLVPNRPQPANDKWCLICVDREAQRAIRERQRLRNERYEREIRDLKAQQPYQELQAALQRTAAVESELDHVKTVLASVVTLIQPIINRPAVTRSPPLQQPQHQQEQHQQVHPQQPPNIGSTPTSAASPGSVGTQGRCSFSEQVHTVPAATNEHSGQDHGQLLIGPIAQQRHLLIHGLDLGPERLGLDIVLDPTRITRMDAHSAQDTSQYRHIPMKHDWTATSALPGALPTDHTGNNSGARSNQSPPPLHAPPPFMPISISQTDIKNCAPTCPLDSLLQDFLAERRERFSEGLPAQEILGPRYPSVSSLLNPSHAAFSHPLSKVFTDIIARFPELCGIPERIAVLYSMFLLMRWQVSPTPENYTRMPEWLRPRPSQLSIPHPTWIDHLPFPAMRERLVSRGWYPFENFTIPFTTTLSVNWPYEDVDALLRSPVGDELMINPVFERHVCRLENWTLGDAFDDAYPGLRGTYGFRSERQGGVIKPAECENERREGEGWGGSL